MRKRYNFWLDDKNQNDWKINELITNLKKAGQFTRAIREGLRLWVDLRNGNTTVLIELFPFIEAKLTPPSTTPTTDGGGQSELAKEIAAQIILQGGTPGYTMQSVQHLGGLITPTDIEFLNRPKPAPAMAAPKAEVKQAAPVDADAIADNFLSMFT